MTARTPTLARGLFAALLLAAVPGPAVAQGPEAPSEGVEPAAEAAARWVDLVDRGRYVESWTRSAAYFKQQMPTERWDAMLERVRRPLEPVTNRTRLSAEATDSLPGAPPGDYVVVHYSVRTAAGESMNEIVVMRREDDEWKPAGYFIRPAPGAP